MFLYILSVKYTADTVHLLVRYFVRRPQGKAVIQDAFVLYFNHGNEEVISDKRCCFLEQQTE